ncbi:MAG: aldose 1-epimerase, partial [Gemmataceae bacterium]|nr:aldose 1-epimerase [Gemmataceae bacterium]
VGECILAEDLPEVVHLWPANFKIQVTYRLFRQCLRVEATVTNVDNKPLPFGLGYHPYFRLPGVQDADMSRYVVQVPAEKIWISDELLPTGERQAVPPQWDFRQGKTVGDARWDLVLTELTSAPQADGLRTLARLHHPAASGQVEVRATPAFREVVLFTPPHRQALAIEPYTCAADAANLAARHVDSGWTVLRPGEKWESAVEYTWLAAMV